LRPQLQLHGLCQARSAHRLTGSNHLKINRI
jgi:hypothetical protein